MRKRTLSVVAALLLAGCTATAPGGPDTGPTETTELAGSGQCEPAGVPTADAGENAPTYPTLSAASNRSSAEEYVREFEEAYAWHRAHDGTRDEVTVRIHQVGVEETGEGYVVGIEEVVVTTRSGTEIGDDSWSAFYLINGSTVLRGEGHAGVPAEAPPRSEWAVVCS